MCIPNYKIPEMLQEAKDSLLHPLRAHPRRRGSRRLPRHVSMRGDRAVLIPSPRESRKLIVPFFCQAGGHRECDNCEMFNGNKNTNFIPDEGYDGRDVIM